MCIDNDPFKIQLISCILNWEMCRYGDKYLIVKILLVITFMEMCRSVLIMILSKYNLFHVF